MKYTITLIPGDGIGPEVTSAARMVLEASGVNINWEIVEAGEKVIKKYGTPLPKHLLDNIRKNKVALKGPVTTPIGGGFRSINVTLRKSLDLYANVRPIKNYPGIPSKYSDIDLVIVRENTEGLYSGIEHMIGEDAAESIKVITRKASKRISKFAFDLARNERRKKVTVVHKANIMKCTDGLFLACAKEVAQKYPEIIFEEMIVDAMSMKLVQMPQDYEILVMPNLYGDILSDLSAGLVGGLGVVPGMNVGDETVVFEPVHGTAPKGLKAHTANPTATILSGVMMLRHLGEKNAADRIEKAMMRVLKEGKIITPDLGGKADTIKYTRAIIEILK